MKQKLLILALGSLVLAGCSTRYEIRLSNGSTFTTKGRPQFDAKRNLWFYTDIWGQTNSVSGLRVTEVGPASSHGSDSKFISGPVR